MKHNLGATLNRVLPALLLATVGLWSFWMFGLFGRSLLSSPEPAREISPRQVDTARVHLGGGMLGNPRTPIEIVEFSDFQCPACKVLSASLDSLLMLDSALVHVRFRHYPLVDIHPSSLAAATASQCANNQHKFTRFHDLVFSQQEYVGLRPWTTFADDAGIPDTLTFISCTHSAVAMAAVAMDTLRARALGVRATPSFIIGDSMWTGSLSTAMLSRIVRRIASQRCTGSC